MSEFKEFDIDLEEFSYPNCPDCGKQVTNITHGRQLTSYPPHSYFKCDHCDFQGYVKLELSEKVKKKVQERIDKGIGLKFSVGYKIINDGLLKIL